MRFKTVCILFCSVFLCISLSLISSSTVPSLAHSVGYRTVSGSESFDNSNRLQKNLISSSANSIKQISSQTKEYEKNISNRLEGIWYNELGSTMTISHVLQGKLTGSYATAVSGGGCAQGAFSLAGRTDVDSGGQNVAFAVSFRNEISNCRSATAWSGQLQNINGEDRITTTWLLTRATEPSNNWQSTIVGQNVFKRYPYAK